VFFFFYLADRGPVGDESVRRSAPDFDDASAKGVGEKGVDGADPKKPSLRVADDAFGRRMLSLPAAE